MRIWVCAKRRISDIKSEDNEIAYARKSKWVGDSPMGELYLPRHDFMQRNGLFPPSGLT